MGDELLHGAEIAGEPLHAVHEDVLKIDEEGERREPRVNLTRSSPGQMLVPNFYLGGQ